MSKLSYDAAYLRQYRRKNPDKQKEWRTRSEIKHLESCGYTVTMATKRKQPEEMTLEELEDFISSEREKKRAYFREYRKKHPEKFRQNTEKTREYKRRWRAKHRDQINAYARKWSADHPDRVRAYRKAWESKNPDYAKKRWQRYTDALEKARREQQARIRNDIKTARAEKEGSDNK